MIVLTKNPFWEKRILPMYSLLLGNPVVNLSPADLGRRKDLLGGKLVVSRLIGR